MQYLGKPNSRFTVSKICQRQVKTRKEGRKCGVRHMVKDLSDIERGNLLPSHGLFFPISSKCSFIYITHTMVFVTPVVEHWLEREIAQ